jgi:hypothetical protein
VVLLTVAVKLCVAPSSTAPDGGETVTVIVGGGGGGGGATGLTPPPPQPSVHAPAVRSTHRNTATTPVLRLVPHTHMHRGEATHPPPSAIIRRFRSRIFFRKFPSVRSESKSKVFWHLGVMRTYFHRPLGLSGACSILNHLPGFVPTWNGRPAAVPFWPKNACPALDSPR